MQIQLYTTAGCHLCENVEVMLSYLLRYATQQDLVFEVVKVDIANSDALLSRFAEEIPVLEIQGKFLKWPFQFTELTLWYEANQ